MSVNKKLIQEVAFIRESFLGKLTYMNMACVPGGKLPYLLTGISASCTIRLKLRMRVADVCEQNRRTMAMDRRY